MSNYLLELSVIHIALILGYWFFLRKERQYSKMRLYLIGSTLLALTIPLLKLPRLLLNSNEPIDAVVMQATSLETMTITSAADMSGWDYDFLIWIYVAVSAFFLFKFLSGVFYLIRLERKSSYVKLNGMYIRKVRDIKGSFTFFNWIFVSDEIDTNEQTYGAILKHEKAHASLGHTYDVMFFGLFRVFFWWLPTTWFIIRELKKIHEYQADAFALKSCDVEQYSSILINSTLKTNGLALPAAKEPSRWQAGLASSFHEGLILKRLIAMKQQAKNVSPWKLGALSALCALLFVVFACSEEVDQQIKEVGSQSNSITFGQLPVPMQADLADIRDQLSFIKVIISEDDKVSDIEGLQELDPELIHSMNVDKTDRVIYIALKKDGANFDYLADRSRTLGGVFTVVEKQPESEGGIKGFRSYIANEIRYPLEARQAGVEGRVDVQFVVEKDGSLSEVQAIRGIGAGCDEEAVRVLQNAPRFKPGSQNGKPVRVRMVVPITFKLNEGKTNPDNSTQGMVIIEQVEGRYEKLTVDADYANGEWSGTVSDEEGNGLPGANIVVAGTTTGTVSDLDGKFKVKGDESNDLNISFIGYESVRLEGK